LKDGFYYGIEVTRLNGLLPFSKGFIETRETKEDPKKLFEKVGTYMELMNKKININESCFESFIKKIKKSEL